MIYWSHSFLFLLDFMFYCFACILSNDEINGSLDRCYSWVGSLDHYLVSVSNTLQGYHIGLRILPDHGFIWSDSFDLIHLSINCVVSIPFPLGECMHIREIENCDLYLWERIVSVKFCFSEPNKRSSWDMGFWFNRWIYFARWYNGSSFSN